MPAQNAEIVRAGFDALSHGDLAGVLQVIDQWYDPQEFFEGGDKVVRVTQHSDRREALEAAGVAE